jgi:hypothetical protein
MKAVTTLKLNTTTTADAVDRSITIQIHTKGRNIE